MVIQAIANVADPSYKCIAHGIAADALFGAGVSKQIEEVHHIKEKVQQEILLVPSVCKVVSDVTGATIYNLVDKRTRYDKLTYDNLFACLKILKDMIIEDGVSTILLPRIGSGKDKLDWDTILHEIENIFEGVDATIYLCNYFF